MNAVQKIAGLKDQEKVCVTLDRVLLESRNRIYHSMSEARDEPAVYKCFAIPGVKAVQVMQNLITVQRESNADWMELIPALKRVLNSHFDKIDREKNRGGGKPAVSKK